MMALYCMEVIASNIPKDREQKELFIQVGYMVGHAIGYNIITHTFKDTWLLKMTPDLKGVKWEKRKKSGFAPGYVQNAVKHVHM